jgi:2-amino-4-hydroxy-6-hydroxymethyldihydropteridine diphosphokinase
LTKRRRAYIGLGGNLGEVEQNLRHAVRALAALPGARLRAVSPLYRTRPVGVEGQPDFLNAVAALDVPAGPDPQTGALALLAALKHIEAAVGRRPSERWGPREIDLDLLLFGRHEISATRPDGRWLEVPHPQMRERLFVLQPLADLAPGLRPPGWRETVATARDRRRAVEGESAVRPAGELA